MASIVSALGMSNSKGNAFSAATRFNISLMASDRESPMEASTAEVDLQQKNGQKAMPGRFCPGFREIFSRHLAVS